MDCCSAETKASSFELWEMKSLLTADLNQYGKRRRSSRRIAPAATRDSNLQVAPDGVRDRAQTRKELAERFGHEGLLAVAHRGVRRVVYLEHDAVGAGGNRREGH